MQLKEVMKFILFGSALLCFFGCRDADLINDEETIYSIIIDDLAKPYPPPRPPSEGDFKPMSKDVIDSISRIKLNVAVAPYFELLERQINLPDLELEYQELARILFVKDTVHELSQKTIHSNLGHKVFIVNQNQIDNKQQLFKDFNQVIHLSNIKFNQKRSRAVVYAGNMFPGKLSGMGILYLFKRENGRWVLDNRKALEIS